MFNLKITKMKNLFSLLCLVVLLGVSVNVMGQASTGTTPFLGATHTYTVEFTTGNTYVWTVTKGDLVLPAQTTSVDDYVLTQNTNGNVATILWKNTASTTEDYYVRVVETVGNTLSGCSNTKIIKVNPQASKFYAVIAADNTDDCYDSPVAVDLLATAPQYTHGAATLTYTVTATNPQGDWTFDIASLITPVVALREFTVVPSIHSTSTAVAELSSSTVTVNSGTTSVKLQFVVTKTAVETNTTDATATAADFSSKITINNIHSGVGGSINDNDTGDKEATTNVVRPHTGNIITEE